jgi:thiol-disulfide isomerase/thioredoxin
MLFRSLFISLLLFCIGVQAIETRAKNFSLLDIQNNQKIILSNYHGKVIYLDFWASWCSSCAKALPLFKKWQHELGDNFVVISVNVDEDKADGIAMAKKLLLNYPIAYDGNLKVAKMYGVSVLPFSFIINRKGNIHYIQVGFKDADAKKLEIILKELLAK